jgi:hypothetical protein
MELQEKMKHAKTSREVEELADQLKKLLSKYEESLRKRPRGSDRRDDRDKSAQH